MNIACYSVIALLPNKKMLISTLKVMSGGKKKLIKSADEFKAQAQESLSLLDVQMDGKEFICGKNFTLADIMLFCFLNFGSTVGQEINPETKNILSWFKKVEKRPSASA